MRGFQRLASAARGTFWLLRATGLRDHFSKVESRLNDLDTKVLGVASQSTTAMRVADNVERLEKQISDVMADVSSQHATTVRVAESIQRLGKHIVDVAATNLTNGRLSEQFQKLEKHLSAIGPSHLANGRLTEQFRKLEQHVETVVAEAFRKLERQLEAAVQLRQGIICGRTLEDSVPLPEANSGLLPEREFVTYVFEAREWAPLEFTFWGGKHHENVRWVGACGDG